MGGALHHLTRHECADLLGTQAVGRIGISHNGEVHILPVNYRYHDGFVVFRTEFRGVLSVLRRPGTAVSFEIDSLDHERETGWSVLVRGHSWPVVNPAELVHLWSEGALDPWAHGLRIELIQILPHEMTGRRIVPVRHPVDENF